MIAGTDSHAYRHANITTTKMPACLQRTLHRERLPHGTEVGVVVEVDVAVDGAVGLDVAEGGMAGMVDLPETVAEAGVVRLRRWGNCRATTGTWRLARTGFAVLTIMLEAAITPRQALDAREGMDPRWFTGVPLSSQTRNRESEIVVPSDTTIRAVLRKFERNLESDNQNVV